MKKRGILNAQLSYLLAALGHKDLFMIGDAGMPIPEGVEVVDLVLTAGVPTFKQVLDAVLDEVQVEGYYLAHEIKEFNPELRHICDFSRGGLNVRSCACIQTLLRNHKYALLGAMASVLWLEG